jgi:serine protease inhibitor
MTRRQTLRALGAAGLAAPALEGCGGAHPVRPGPPDAGDLRLVRAPVARSAGDPVAVDPVVSAVGTFATDLWRRVGAAGGNLALSPFSIATALAMTANGAAGATARQMQEVLHAGSLATYNRGMAALTQELAGLAGPVRLADGTRDSITLTSVDQLFGDRGTTWGRPFLTVLAKLYGAGVREVDFRGDPEGARVSVNRWTSEQTRGRIPALLPEGVVDEMTRLVLVNALYFKAPWETPFEKSATRMAMFHRANGGPVPVPMMTGDAEGSAVFLQGQHFTGARLPYREGRLAMTVALPAPGAGGDDAAMAELLGSRGLRLPGEAGVAVTMPRWRYRVPVDLGRTLAALGMPDALDGRLADFSPMTSQERLHISFVLHQTYVAVDEDGTEAAAATAVGMADSAAIRSHSLLLDRPFLFVVHDTAHGTPLFVGRVADPS